MLLSGTKVSAGNAVVFKFNHRTKSDSQKGLYRSSDQKTLSEGFIYHRVVHGISDKMGFEKINKLAREGKRLCLTAVVAPDVKGFMAACVVEDEPEYYKTDWFFSTLADAQAYADEFNKVQGLTKEDAWEIVASSMWPKTKAHEKTAMCPECGEPLEFLNNIVPTRRVYELYSDEHYDELDPACDGDGTYECPHCYEVLARDHGHAMKILKGESTPTVGGKCRECGKSLPEPQMVLCWDCAGPLKGVHTREKGE